MENKKISIVATYHNRKKVFEHTLKSISLSKYKNFEFIVVDDCSDESERIEDLAEKYDFIKLIRLENENKWYVNPCIPFNIGFSEITGDIVIIQNTECFHTIDILEYTANVLTENDYITFATYSLTKEQTDIIVDINENVIEETKKVILPYVIQRSESLGMLGWYNHTQHRPSAYHFCSAIYKDKLSELNGFDERYATGMSYDDNEFLRRIYRLKLKVMISDDNIVYHQYHGRGKPFEGNLLNKNMMLYNSTQNEEIITANPNKKIL